MSSYPDRHHPIYFLQDALDALGADTEAHRDDMTHGLWGLTINGQIMVWLIDIRWPHEQQAHAAGVHRLLDAGALVCAAQQRDAQHYGCRWLPLAATPGYAPPPSPIPKTHDIAFVGYVRDRVRTEMLLDLNRRHSLCVLQGYFGSTASNAYHSAQLGLNIPTRYGDPNAYDINMRVFEVMATGTPLLTNALPELIELGFEDGTHYLGYRDAEDLFRLAQAALRDPHDLRARLPIIGSAAADIIQQAHTYRHRAEKVLTWLT